MRGAGGKGAARAPADGGAAPTASSAASHKRRRTERAGAASGGAGAAAEAANGAASAPDEAADDAGDSVGLALVQAELMRTRALLLRELGLEEGLQAQRALAGSQGGGGGSGSGSRGSSGVARRRVSGDRGAPAQPQRESLRVRGGSAPGAGLGELAEGAASARRGSSSGGGAGAGGGSSTAAAAAASAEGAAAGVEELRGGGPLGALVQARVERDTAIKAFVEGALGIVPYVAGRGYHELVEGLPISIYTCVARSRLAGARAPLFAAAAAPHPLFSLSLHRRPPLPPTPRARCASTEHILESPSGEFYRGGSAEARAACGGAASRVEAGAGSGRAGGAVAGGLPAGWALYLRSRSYARKLRAGQRFIYER